MNQKQCRQCGRTKDRSEFTKRGSSPDGLDPNCKVCQSAMRAARRGSGYPSVSTRVRVPAQVAPVVDPETGEQVLTTAETDYVPSPELLATWAAVQLLARRGRPAANLLFVGPSGSGKTEGARYLARLAGLEFTKVDAPAMTDPEAWFGTREVVVEDGAPKTVVRDSALVEAIQKPGVLLIDEVNRVQDAIRQILLALKDDSRAVTNPLTGQPLVRHPECFIIMTANVGLSFTGTFAMDPALLTRALTTHFDYLPAGKENALARSRTGVDEATAGLFVRFANESRGRAKQDEDFPPISTREVLAACDLVAVGLDPDTATKQVILNSASADGGAESHRAKLDYIWNGIKTRAQG